jgi:PTH1 family peptidyl-tRNA hydrolase
MTLFAKPPVETNTFLLVGLGNPGREYRDTRHNVGFQAIDRLCASFEIKLSRLQSKALVGTGLWEDRKIVLAKPQTFMNLSGQAVASLLRFYKIPLSQLLVLHDDIDLPVGAVRIGVGRPPGQMVAADYVLQDFSKADLELIAVVLDRAVEAARVFVQSGLEKAMNQYNGLVQKE